jgi:Ni,Fe-hydrogenase I cytochrome b subunit
MGTDDYPRFIHVRPSAILDLPMSTQRVLFFFVSVGIALTVIWMGFAIYQERYLEAVAASCLGPALAWFALGMGKSNDE